MGAFNAKLVPFRCFAFIDFEDDRLGDKLASRFEIMDGSLDEMNDGVACLLLQSLIP